MDVLVSVPSLAKEAGNYAVVNESSAKLVPLKFMGQAVKASTTTLIAGSTSNQNEITVDEEMERIKSTLCEGGFVDRADLLAFGLPGRGKTHLVCAIGHELLQRGYQVLFVPATGAASACRQEGDSLWRLPSGASTASTR